MSIVFFLLLWTSHLREIPDQLHLCRFLHVSTTKTCFDATGSHHIKARLGVYTIALGKTCIGAFKPYSPDTGMPKVLTTSSQVFWVIVQVQTVNLNMQYSLAI